MTTLLRPSFRSILLFLKKKKKTMLKPENFYLEIISAWTQLKQNFNFSEPLGRLMKEYFFK